MTHATLSLNARQLTDILRENDKIICKRVPDPMCHSFSLSLSCDRNHEKSLLRNHNRLNNLVQLALCTRGERNDSIRRSIRVSHLKHTWLVESDKRPSDRAGFSLRCFSWGATLLSVLRAVILSYPCEPSFCSSSEASLLSRRLKNTERARYWAIFISGETWLLVSTTFIWDKCENYLLIRRTRRLSLAPPCPPPRCPQPLPPRCSQRAFPEAPPRRACHPTLVWLAPRRVYSHLRILSCFSWTFQPSSPLSQLFRPSRPAAYNVRYFTYKSLLAEKYWNTKVTLSTSVPCFAPLPALPSLCLSLRRR